MRITAQSRQAEFLAAQFLGSFDFRLGDDTVREGIFCAGDKNQIGGALGDGANDRLAAADGDLTIAAEDRRGHQLRRRNIYQLEV